MKTIGGLGVVVIASIALLQPAQGRPAGGGRSYGGGHSFSSGHHFSGTGGRYGGYSGGPRYYARGQYNRRGAGPRTAYQAALRNRAYYSRLGPRGTNVNRTTALNPKSYAFSNSRTVAARQAALRSLGVDTKGRIPAQAGRNWDRGRDHNWHGHRCHWHNNSWVIVDWWPWYYPWDYYPWGYGYYGPYSNYDPGYYEDVYEPAAYSQPAYDEGVRELQSALARKGYYHGAIDGSFGPETRSAVRQYQRNHGFSVTGNIDQAVIDSLRRR